MWLVSKRNMKEVVLKNQPDICFVFEAHVPFTWLWSFWSKLGYCPTCIEEA